MRKMVWPCRVMGRVTIPSGAWRRMDRTVEGAGDVEGAMLRALKARKDGGLPFVGDSIVAITPLGQKVERVVERDCYGKMFLQKP